MPVENSMESLPICYINFTMLYKLQLLYRPHTLQLAHDHVLIMKYIQNKIFASMQ